MGKKVAICDQVDSPQPGKLVKREVTRMLTPGTRIESSQLEASRNNYMLAITFVDQELQAAWLDLSTGDFQIASDKNYDNLLSVFYSIDPQEIVLPEWAHKSWESDAWREDFMEKFNYFSQERVISHVADFQFDLVSGARTVIETLGVLGLDGFGIAHKHNALGAAGALVYYATESLCSRPRNLFSIREYKSERSLILDPATLRNLEIFSSSQNTREGSLIQAMDATVTAAGARLLEQFLATPAIDILELKRRQNCVGEFVEEVSLAEQLREQLAQLRDITRILTRLQNRSRNPRELAGIRDTIALLPDIYRLLTEFEGMSVRALANQITTFEALCDLLISALNEELPTKLQEGGVIKKGYDKELDRLLDLTHNSKNWLTEFEHQQQSASGIKNLRVKYNGSFGYFIEVTKSNIDRVPSHYVRKQTMTNAERYYTEELKAKEKEILEAEEKALRCEEALYDELLAQVLEHSSKLAETAEALAEIDLFTGWAQVARDWDYCCPMLDESDALDIKQGRHPVIEQMLSKTRLGLGGSHKFVPNDTYLSASQDQIAVITGPNMAGKSTYIRQVALITLMAQIGSWVPASECRIGIVDRIFSRVGASDELSRGNSTFMVEMNETANILNNCTNRSLIILDEIGRGTSTYDGLSIAWAVVEHLHSNEAEGPRTLFATHYHELPQLESSLPRLRNFSVSVKEWNDEIIFVRQVIPGAADKSYGIQVARLAGLPKSVIDRANEVLAELENEGVSLRQHLKKTPYRKDRVLIKQSAVEEEASSQQQLNLFMD